MRKIDNTTPYHFFMFTLGLLQVYSRFTPDLPSTLVIFHAYFRNLPSFSTGLLQFNSKCTPSSLQVYSRFTLCRLQVSSMCTPGLL